MSVSQGFLQTDKTGNYQLEFPCVVVSKCRNNGLKKPKSFTAAYIISNGTAKKKLAKRYSCKAGGK